MVVWNWTVGRWDGGEELDGGVELNGGMGLDGGVELNGGMGLDSGVELDGGMGLDGGVGLDGGGELGYMGWGFLVWLCRGWLFVLEFLWRRFSVEVTLFLSLSLSSWREEVVF